MRFTATSKERQVNIPVHSTVGSSARSTVFAACVLAASAASQASVGEEVAPPRPAIDQRSYRLGGIDSFAEVVNLGIKKMALSAAMSPQEMDALVEEAGRIARNNEVELYREADFLVTDLFPLSATQGKHVLIIYRGSTKNEYVALKKQKAELVKEGKYTGEAREQIARKLGRLLSYPEAKIDQLLKEHPTKSR